MVHNGGPNHYVWHIADGTVMEYTSSSNFGAGREAPAGSISGNTFTITFKDNATFHYYNITAISWSE